MLIFWVLIAVFAVIGLFVILGGGIELILRLGLSSHLEGLLSVTWVLVCFPGVPALITYMFGGFG